MPEYLFHILPLTVVGLPIYFLSKNYFKKRIKSSRKLFLASTLTTVVLAIVIYSSSIILFSIYAINASEF